MAPFGYRLLTESIQIIRPRQGQFLSRLNVHMHPIRRDTVRFSIYLHLRRLAIPLHILFSQVATMLDRFYAFG